MGAPDSPCFTETRDDDAPMISMRRSSTSLSKEDESAIKDALNNNEGATLWSWPSTASMSALLYPPKANGHVASIKHCRTPSRKRKHAAISSANVIDKANKNPLQKNARYCTIYDIHRANLLLLRWLLKQMIINMPYYCCKRSIQDFKRLLRLLRWILWPDPRRLIVSRKQIRSLCHMTVAISYYLLRVQMRCLYHGGRGLSQTLASARNYRAAYNWSRTLRRALYGKRGRQGADLSSSSGVCTPKRTESYDSLDMATLGDDSDDEDGAYEDQHNHIIKQYNTRFSLYRAMPLKAMSRVWGSINTIDLPTFARGPAYKFYSWLYSCSIHEAEITDLQHYKNLSEFFRRSLRKELRPVDGLHQLTSPADGTVLHLGQVKDGLIEQVKGVTYSLRGFLDPDLSLVSTDDEANVAAYMNDGEFARRLLTNKQHELYYSVIYLSPGDYHRFHSPANWTAYMRRHFPGELFSVNPNIARWLQGLFNLNERAVYSGQWQYGFFSMAAVGATNVGSINVYMDQDMKTNTGKQYEPGEYFDKCLYTGRHHGIKMKKGELVGDFNFGSTIVLIFEAPANFQFKVESGKKVRYGQPLGWYENNRMKRRRMR